SSPLTPTFFNEALWSSRSLVDGKAGVVSPVGASSRANLQKTLNFSLLTLMRLIPAITLILALLSAACSGTARRAARADMSRAEALFDSLPDSAIAILSDIPPSQLGRADRSRLAVLQAEARYKAGFDDTASSALDSAVDYLRLRFSHPLRASAYHLSAIQACNRGDYSRAVLSLLNAEKSAELTSDSLRLALIYRSLADCFTNLGDFLTAHAYYRNSYFLFEKLHSSRYTPYALYDLAKSHLNIYDLDSALFLTDTLSIIAAKIGDRNLIDYAGQLKFRMLFSSKRYKDVIMKYQEGINPITTSDSLKNWYFIGLSSLLEGDIESAKKFNKLILNHPAANTIDIVTHHYLDARLKREAGDYKSAISLYDSIQRHNNDLFLNYYTSPLTSTLFKYHTYERQLANHEIRNQHFLIWIIITISLVIICSFSFLFIYRERQHKARLTAQYTALCEFQNRLANLQERFDASDSRYKNKELDTINQLYTALYASPQRKNLKDSLIRHITAGLKRMQSDEVSAEMARIIDIDTDGAFSQFRREFPDLNPEDYKLVLYVAAGLSVYSIAVLLDIKIETVYNRRSRLRRRLSTIDPIKADHYKGRFI
ncbi:MAG: hypothetical protein K2M04_06605, partial [Muribaculaceae bacterium]|nr:hypothetical protein [Muribaculaceae bacterium]